MSPHPEFRATRDLDLLGFISHEIGSVRAAFTAICEQVIDEDDGLLFNTETLRVEEIREQQEYGGLRVSVVARLGPACEAIVQLGMANSRMKDYYDPWFLSRRFEFEGDLVAQALRATFERRRTALPRGVPTGLAGTFAADTSHITQWGAFVRRFVTGAPERLETVVDGVRDFLMPALSAAANASPFLMRWSQGRWQSPQ